MDLRSEGQQQHYSNDGDDNCFDETAWLSKSRTCEWWVSSEWLWVYLLIISLLVFKEEVWIPNWVNQGNLTCLESSGLFLFEDFGLGRSKYWGRKRLGSRIRWPWISTPGWFPVAQGENSWLLLACLLNMGAIPAQLASWSHIGNIWKWESVMFIGSLKWIGDVSAKARLLGFCKHYRRMSYHICIV